ncbi:MAG: hypothetical protein DSY66_02140 [Persephonella sp.]|nr:MAG: hypothetical protein DSY53_03675 [Persephonella sp.]RUM61410.1 MAG: hypothetical protein DSY66_02140 [Persephonella sp.]
MLKKLSFSLFDTGETILGALIFSIFFPLYITQYIDVNVYTFLYGIVFILSFVISLYLGKLADERNLRKKLFIIFTVGITVLTFLLYITNNNHIASLIIFFLLAILHQQNLVFYNSLLTDFKDKGFVSGLGVSFGYIGSALALIFFSQYLEIPTVYIVAGIIFFIFAVPSIINVENPNIKSKKIDLKNIFKDKEFLLIILSILFLTEIANTLISLMAVYLKNVYHLQDKEIYKIIGISSIGGVLGGFVWGFFSRLIEIKKLFFLGFVMWFIFLSTLPFTPKNLLTFIGFFAGFSLAHLWTTSRVLIIEVFPKNEVSTRLSFLSLTERISSSFGLIIWSALLTLTKDYQTTVLLMNGFIIIGGLIYVFRERIILLIENVKT